MLNSMFYHRIIIGRDSRLHHSLVATHGIGQSHIENFGIGEFESRDCCFWFASYFKNWFSWHFFGPYCNLTGENFCCASVVWLLVTSLFRGKLFEKCDHILFLFCQFFLLVNKMDYLGQASDTIASFILMRRICRIITQTYALVWAEQPWNGEIWYCRCLCFCSWFWIIIMVRVWYMDDEEATDQRSPHMTDPPDFVSLDVLAKFGVNYWQVWTLA